MAPIGILCLSVCIAVLNYVILDNIPCQYVHNKRFQRSSSTETVSLKGHVSLVVVNLILMGIIRLLRDIHSPLITILGLLRDKWPCKKPTWVYQRSSQCLLLLRSTLRRLCYRVTIKTRLRHFFPSYDTFHKLFICDFFPKTNLRNFHI